MAYKKDYNKTFACIPLAMAQALVEKGFWDDVDIAHCAGRHIFRDELLYLMDIPLSSVPLAIDSPEFTKQGYSDVYIDIVTKSHFESIIRPILLTRLELGI